MHHCSTAIAIRCKDGVVFGVEKLVLSKLYEEGSNKRIFNIDRHVGMVTHILSCCQWSQVLTVVMDAVTYYRKWNHLISSLSAGSRWPVGWRSLTSRCCQRRSIKFQVKLWIQHSSKGLSTDQYFIISQISMLPSIWSILYQYCTVFSGLISDWCFFFCHWLLWETNMRHVWLSGLLINQLMLIDPQTVRMCVLQHLSDRVAMYVHAYTLYSAVRPFGCRWVQRHTRVAMFSNNANTLMNTVHQDGMMTVTQVSLNGLNSCDVTSYWLSDVCLSWSHAHKLTQRPTVAYIVWDVIVWWGCCVC